MMNGYFEGRTKNVFVSDQTTNPVIAKFNYENGFTFTTSATVVGEYTVSLTDVTDFVVGNYVIIYSPDDKRFYLGYVLSVSGTDITVDSPFDFAFPIGSIIKSTTTNMNVDGSSTPLVYGLRGVSEEYPFDMTFDITRLIFSCQTSSACSLALFANITELTNGLIFRKKNGVYQNIFNVKSNADLAGIMYDFTITDAQNTQQGQYGFYGRITFAGNDKIGVALRIASGEDIQFLIQDDLSTITKLEVVAEGHITAGT